MKRIFAILLIVLSVSAIVFYSCEKNEVDTDTQSAIDNSQSARMFTNTFSEIKTIGIDEVGIHGKKADTAGNGCPTITVEIDSTTNTGTPIKRLIIDYGTNGCVAADGILRKGKLIAEYSGYWDIVGSYAMAEFDNFYSDGIKMEGSIRVEIVGNEKYQLEVSNGKIHTSPSAIEWNCTQVYTVIQQNDAATSENEMIYTIEGSSSGVNRAGRSYTSEITTPLRKEMTCDWYVSGVYELTPDGLATRSVDFGNGTCDQKATLTVDGITIEFDLN